MNWQRRYNALYTRSLLLFLQSVSSKTEARAHRLCLCFVLSLSIEALRVRHAATVVSMLRPIAAHESIIPGFVTNLGDVRAKLPAVLKTTRRAAPHCPHKNDNVTSSRVNSQHLALHLTMRPANVKRPPNVVVVIAADACVAFCATRVFFYI